MEIVYKKIGELKPYENNPRKNDEAVDAVAASISEFGWKVPVVIDADNVIVAGHTRYKAAKKLGIEDIPCIVADDLTEEQVRAYRLADNKVGELAGWDFQLLSEELEGLNIDMEQFGFDDLGDDHNEYLDSFFDRGVETKQKQEVLGVKVVCGSQEQVQQVYDLLIDNGYNPEML